ncbi:acyl-CoA dehydrogenase family protein [Pseudonocardia sp. DSM 110487]|uniref:acyl-CoA dehydrogenase n=1 Tax=Pseudonocardia sp. DSM 110487 TaxID=2865833 RepID=UPI001C6993A7|nr:acyl-CoA dehydrogenase family protein [Pseudonocardia sp. DSM 110487]QYN36868.1 acyl-CoA dehydrogenase family protein [Pseudonocardia sp. DSM 110487]
MAIATTDEQLALQDAVRACVARLDGTAAVRAAEHDPDFAAHWAALSAIGIFGVALPGAVGGGGGSVVDAAAAVEQCAAELVPGPVVGTVLAGLLLAARHEAPVAKELLPGLASGETAVALALDACSAKALDAAGSGLRVSGEISTVLGAGSAPLLLLAAGDVWFVIDADHPGLTVEQRLPVDFSRALGRVVLRDVEVPAARVVPDVVAGEVRDLAAVLLAAESAGVAGWCLRAATAHAKVREQFGRPIGSFQAVKHLCAEMLCRVEQAGVVAWDAARAVEDASDELPLAAAVAAAVGLDAAVDTAKDAIQVLGGIGFTWEHDAHLYLRRALANRQLLGGTAGWRRRATDLAIGGARRTLAIALDPATEARRSEVRAAVAELAALPADQRRRHLADIGYLAPHWPAPHGLDAPPALQLLIDEELRRARVSRPDLVIGAWAVPTLLQHGTPEQQERFAAPTLRGEITWCQLFSEPEAGSDLAGLRTRAERVDGGWVLTGQKVWTSLAREAHWAICLARTDPQAPRHRGITYFLVDMTSPGIEVRPLREITGEAVFNEVFLDRVFVPDSDVVGEVGGGWALARTTLANERVAIGSGSALGQAVERLLELEPPADAREPIGALVAQGSVVSLLDLRATLLRLGGQDPGPGSAVRKLVGVRHRQDVAEMALTLAGPDAAADDGASAVLVHEFLLSRCHSIAGGTTQILLNLVGERILGLPREPAVG